MVKKICIVMLLSSAMYAQNIYEKKCVSCHASLPTSLQGMFMRYLLVYSGEKNVKAGLKHYLKYPNKDISVMSDLFINTYGVKDKTRLSDEMLDEILDIYWEKFKVFDKLK